MNPKPKKKLNISLYWMYAIIILVLVGLYYLDQNSRWIVIDYGDTFVHVFLPEEREHYNLEELWSDAKTTYLPDID